MVVLKKAEGSIDKLLGEAHGLIYPNKGLRNLPRIPSDTLGNPNTNIQIHKNLI